MKLTHWIEVVLRKISNRLTIACHIVYLSSMIKPRKEPALIWRSVRLTDWTLIDLERLAKKDDRSVSFLIRRAIEQYVNRRPA